MDKKVIIVANMRNLNNRQNKIQILSLPGWRLPKRKQMPETGCRIQDKKCRGQKTAVKGRKPKITKWATFFGLLLAGVFQFGMMLVALGSDSDTKPRLRQFDIRTISLPGKIEDINLLDLNGDGLVDVLVNRYEESGKTFQRYLDVFYQKKGKGFETQPTGSVVVPVTATAYALGNWSDTPGIEVAYFTKGGLDYQNLNSLLTPQAELKPLIRNNHLLAYPVKYSLPLYLTPTDIDGNGSDDLIVPEEDGYRIYFQSRLTGQAEQFTTAFIPLKSEKRFEQNSLYFLAIQDALPNFLIKDVNNDGLKDIVIFDKNKLSYYLQTDAKEAGGRFRSKPSLEVPLTIITEMNANEVRQVNTRLNDINRDGLDDIILSMTGGAVDDLGSIQTSIFTFLAQRNGPNNFQYPANPTQIINIKGVVPFWALTDLNEDNYPDLITASFQMDLGSNIQKAILRYLHLTYKIQSYQEKNQQFAKYPDYEKTINFPLDLIGRGEKYFSHIYFQDFNGDHRPDVLTIRGPDRKNGELIIQLAKTKEDLRNPRAIAFWKDEYVKYPLEIPAGVKVSDLNADGRADIILQYKSQFIIMLSK